jgi:hypothetical protein
MNKNAGILFIFMILAVFTRFVNRVEILTDQMSQSGTDPRLKA